MNERERFRLVFANLGAVKKPSMGIQPVSKLKKSEAVEVTLRVSMHAGQIIMLTKMLTTSDLRFYDFEADAPVERWHEAIRDSG